MLTELEFNCLVKQGYNRIPLVVEYLADLETPLTIYLKLISKSTTKNTFLLEFLNKKNKFNRYSYIGLPAAIEIKSFNNKTDILKNGKIIESTDCNIFDFINKFQTRYKIAILPGMPNFCGGLVGYFAYDSIKYIEKRILFRKKMYNDLFLPDVLLFLTEEIIVVDNFLKKIYLIVYANSEIFESYKKSQIRIKKILNLLKKKIKVPLNNKSSFTKEYKYFKKNDFIKSVLKAKEYILSGDIMQIQISQRIRKSFVDSPINLYRALKFLNPSPYMYLYDFGQFQIVGSSPEILVKNEIVNNNKNNVYKKVTIRPLAGTRPRSKNKKYDKLLSSELLSDSKEQAEHIMLIDLARNDISRISITGSVKVTEKMVLEKYSHVQHIVSNIEGVLKFGLSNIDILKATFPAGTLSGTPKIRAIEIIDKLENVNRGIYGGACGYLSFNGEMNVAILIRTGIIKDGFLYAQAAAGIVYDSIPDIEWQETENKIRVILKAAEKVQNGFL